jgi:membrane-associated phospholipid phosphatase
MTRSLHPLGGVRGCPATDVGKVAPMTGSSPHADTPERPPAPEQAGARFGARALLLGLALALLAVPFSLLLFLVEDRWRPLLDADGGARDDLHRYALDHPDFVTAMKTLSDSGSALAWGIVFVLVVAWLLWRRLPRLAVFVAVTVAGSSLVNTAVKTVVHRTRPAVVDPVVHERGLSFPSGHSQAAVVGYAVLLLVFLPVLTRTWRRVAVALAVLLVLAIGFSRVALAAHYVSDVLAGYLLGAAWVAVMTALFSIWRTDRGRPPVEPARGLEPDQAHRISP